MLEHYMAVSIWCFEVASAHRNHRSRDSSCNIRSAAQLITDETIYVCCWHNREYERTACLCLACDIVMLHLFVMLKLQLDTVN